MFFCLRSEAGESPDILEGGPNPDFIAGITKGAAPLQERPLTWTQFLIPNGPSVLSALEEINYTWPGLYENSALLDQDIHSMSQKRAKLMTLEYFRSAMKCCPVPKLRFRKLRQQINTLAKLYLKRTSNDSG